MAIGARKAKKKASDQPQVGTHAGRLVGIVDLGEQPGFNYQGKDIEPQHQITFTYELPKSKMQDGRPHFTSEDMQNSDFFDPKKGLASKLMKRVYALDPSGNTSNHGANLETLLTAPCMIEVGANDKGYTKIKNVTGVPSDYPIPELTNDVFVFTLDDPDVEMFRRFPEFVQKKILSNLNYEGSKLQKRLLADNYQAPEGDF